MNRSPDDFPNRLNEAPDAELLLGHSIAIELPDGWTLVSADCDGRPPIAGLNSFIEFADDEVVVTVLTRDYSHGPDRLLDEIIGQGAGSGDPTTVHTDLKLRPNVRGRARCGADEAEEFFVAALVIEGQVDAPTGRIGIEVVAAGPTGTIAGRLPLLLSMVSTVGHR